MYLLLYRHPIIYPAYRMQLERGFGYIEVTRGLMCSQDSLSSKQLDALVGVRYAFELISTGVDPYQLIENTKRRSIYPQVFVIDYSRIEKHYARLPSRRLLGQLALAIDGDISYEQPTTRYHLIETVDRYYLMRQVHVPKWNKPNYAYRPHSYSAALSNEFAALAINTIARPKDRLVDPTCGSGTIIYEALQRGMRAWGYDHKWSWVKGARENLAYFGFTRSSSSPHLVSYADAREVEFESDVVIANLPYGRVVNADMTTLREIVGHLHHCAVRFAFFSGQPIDDILKESGYVNIESVDLSTKSPHHRFLSFAQRGD
jgi:hypothetical protein